MRYCLKPAGRAGRLKFSIQSGLSGFFLAAAAWPAAGRSIHWRLENPKSKWRRNTAPGCLGDPVRQRRFPHSDEVESGLQTR